MVLSPSGEVATFIDVNQFSGGKSVEKCVAFSACEIALCGRPDSQSYASTTTLTLLASTWYSRLEGQDIASNTNGMTLDALYTMLHGLGLQYTPLPITPDTQHNDDMAHVKEALGRGHPVLLCGHEDGYYDIGLGDKVPYNWVPCGNHAVTATGIASDRNFLVRDSANVDKNGIIRPGPRHYDNSKMFLISATEVIPKWMQVAPAPVVVKPAPPKQLEFTPPDLYVWTMFKPNIRQNTGIAQEWLRARQRHSMELGGPEDEERDVVYNGEHYAEQRFDHAVAQWRHKTNECVWYDSRGSFKVPA